MKKTDFKSLLLILVISFSVTIAKAKVSSDKKYMLPTIARNVIKPNQSLLFNNLFDKSDFYHSNTLLQNEMSSIASITPLSKTKFPSLQCLPQSPIISNIQYNQSIIKTLPAVTENPSPINWIKAYSEHQKDDNQIYWTTTNEANSDYYIIEASVDSKNFDEIGRVKATGNLTSNNNYVFIHKQPNEGIYFYRIKHIDFAGNAHYSKIMMMLQSQNSLLSKAILYPTPVNDVAALSVTLNDNSNVLITVNDMNGKTVYTKNASLTKGNNLLSFEMGNCAAGIYSLQITNDVEILYTSKFIKK